MSDIETGCRTQTRNTFLHEGFDEPKAVDEGAISRVRYRGRVADGAGQEDA
jgi:hypothetical protein